MTLKDVEGSGGTLIWGTVLQQRSTGMAGEKQDKIQIRIKFCIMGSGSWRRRFARLNDIINVWATRYSAFNHFAIATSIDQSF
jgi:hypothetical protein